MEIENNIGARMRLFREHLKLSQQALADVIGNSKVSLQNNEMGKALPNSKLLVHYASLGCDLNWLITGEGEMLKSASDKKTFIIQQANEYLDSSHTPFDGSRLAMSIQIIEEIIESGDIDIAPDLKGSIITIVYKHSLVESNKEELKKLAQMLIK